MKIKKTYYNFYMIPVAVSSGSPILSGSVVNKSTITAVGQELGETYDMSSDIDSNTGKTFSHEWDAN